MLVLYWTGTWWSRVNDEMVKEGKRLITLGYTASFCTPGNQPEIERWRERERERGRKEERHRDPSSDGAKVF